MDAENDTQVVKQSTSSMVAVFLGMFLTMVSSVFLIGCINFNVNSNLIIFIPIVVFTFLELILVKYLNKKGVERLNRIQV